MHEFSHKRLASYELLIWTIPPSLAYYPLLSQLSFYWYKGNKDSLAKAWIEISRYYQMKNFLFSIAIGNFLFELF